MIERQQRGSLTRQCPSVRSLTFEYCSSIWVFDIQYARSTIHNWVHKANLQPDSGKNLDHVTVYETVIQLNDERYWLYAAVDPETNELLYISLEPTTNTVIAQTLLVETDEKPDISDAVFFIHGSHRYNLRVIERATVSDMKSMEIGMPSNVSFVK